VSIFKNIRIGDFCDTGSGSTPSRDQMARYYENGTIPWVKSGELRESVINATEEHITEAALHETSVKLVPANSLLVAMYGATVGRLGILGMQATTNQAVCHVIPDPKQADVRYLFRALETKVSEMLRRAIGGAQPNINQSIVRDIQILLPPLEEQRRIAAILDQAETLRTQRRAALAQLDSLTQSIFLEMFGDPNQNNKGWPMGCIKDTLVSASYGTSEKSGEDGEFAVLRMNNITRSGELDMRALKYMDLPSKDHERYLVKPGDILFNRTNSAELVGKTAFIPQSFKKAAYAGYLIRLRSNSDNHPVYLWRLLNSDYAKRMLRGMCKSIIGMANINASEIQAMRIALPPLSLQEMFASRIQTIEAFKTTHSTALAALDDLFASLQHRAFSGTL
jgi:type I restriction enzyme, S subunit